MRCSHAPDFRVPQESKLIGVSTLGKGKGWGKGKGSWAKVDVVPQCFSKCCRP